MAPRLEPAQVRLAWNALLAGEISVGVVPFSEYTETDGQSALAARLEAPQAEATANTLIARLQTSTNSEEIVAAADELTAVAPRLGPAQASQAADVFTRILSKAPESSVRGLTALAPRFEPANAQRAWDNIVVVTQKSSAPLWFFARNDPFKALAMRLTPEQSQRAADALIEILEKPADRRTLGLAADGLIALAPSRASARANRDCDALISMLEKSPERGVVVAVAGVLSALAPRLEAKQAMRACHALMGLAGKSSDNELANVCTALAALARQLDPQSRNNLAAAASARVLDGSGTMSTRLGSDPTIPLFSESAPIEIARLISSPRSLAKLLSHPGCVALARGRLLQRFEEVVLYDGKSVFWKENALDEKTSSADQLPSRQFHNLHDAAAWIQQNWPEFDLETNCPATWRGSH
jgi:hypothetical protein